MLDVEDISDLELIPRMSGESFNKLINYPVIVEMWDRVQERGSVQRRYHAEFTEQERRVLAGYYPKFHKWYLRTGIPLRITLNLGNIELLQRACNFFGAI